jgi:hypothetical protein
VIDLGELRLSDLLREREEHLPERRARERVLLIQVPWPWPWVVLEIGATWICYLEIEPSGNPKKPPRRRAPRVPEEAAGALVALRCTTPSDLNLLASLERRGLAWPSCPDEWRNAVVGVARLEGTIWAGPHALDRFWPLDQPVGWGLSEVVPIEPLRIEGGGWSRIASFPEDLLPELRERWKMGRWGCYRHPRIATD